MKQKATGGGGPELTEGLRRMAIVAVVILLVAVALLWVGTYGARFLLKRRVAGHEAGVLGTLRTLGDALHTYEEKYGGYPDTLVRLTGREEGPADYLPPERARLLDRALAQDRIDKDGYVITYTPTGAGQTWAASVPLVGGYVLEAHPVAAATSKMNFYYADQSRTVRVKRGGPAGPHDPVAPPSP